MDLFQIVYLGTTPPHGPVVEAFCSSSNLHHTDLFKLFHMANVLARNM